MISLVHSRAQQNSDTSLFYTYMSVTIVFKNNMLAVHLMSTTNYMHNRAQQLK